MTKNRLKIKTCPEEHKLNGYLNNSLDPIEHSQIEDHIKNCRYCLYRIAEAARAVKGDLTLKKILAALLAIHRGGNIWITVSMVSFTLSFIFPRHFVQFLVVTIIFGLKWIVDNKNTKTLITIHEACKNKGTESPRSNTPKYM